MHYTYTYVTESSKSRGAAQRRTDTTDRQGIEKHNKHKEMILYNERTRVGGGVS